ncbi:MAG: hypothetical protein K8S62_05545 [Candidatus Sabulitectum sp.]|nr:hypothetical protein [Candidatus Sabulitectum sp.]
MLLWFVSTLFLAYDFPDTELTDLEIDAAGTVWLLPVSDPAVIRLKANGEQNRFETGFADLPAGLALSAAGRWAISFQSSGVLLKYDSDDILLEEIAVPGPGDVLFSGLSIWTVDIMRGNVISSNGEIIARNCGSRDSRLCLERTGLGMISGSRGVFLLEAGEIPVRIADNGSACFSQNGILLLCDGTLKTIEGDTLLTDLPYSRISASPGGETTVLWGNAVPMVLE